MTEEGFYTQMSSLWHLSKLTNLWKHLLTTHEKMQFGSISVIDSKKKKKNRIFFFFNKFEGKNEAITKTAFVNKGIIFPFFPSPMFYPLHSFPLCCSLYCCTSQFVASHFFLCPETNPILFKLIISCLAKNVIPFFCNLKT